MRRIAVLMSFAENDPEAQLRSTAFRQALASFGWREGHNVRFDYRWTAGDLNAIPAAAKELIGGIPDVVVAEGTPAAAALQRETRKLSAVAYSVSAISREIPFAAPSTFCLGVWKIGNFGTGRTGHSQIQIRPNGAITGGRDMAIPSAVEVSGDVVSASTALAGLILVFLGATSTSYDSYQATERGAVRSRYQRRAWFAFNKAVHGPLAILTMVNV
jgi:hypothetical protein